MKALFSLTNHNIHFAASALAKWAECPKVSVLSLDHVINTPTSERHVLLVPTVQVLKRNARMLNDCPNIVVIVFDAPVLCKEVGAHALDVERQTLDFKFTFHHLEPRDIVHAVRTAFAGSAVAKITKQQIDMSTKLLKRVYGSIIGRFLTFMYKVPDTDKRAELQKAVFGAWWNDDVPGLIKYLEQRYPKNKHAQDFVQQLNEKDGVAFLAAVKRLRELRDAGKKVAYPQLSKEFKVSVFDLRYFAKGIQ